MTVSISVAFLGVDRFVDVLLQNLNSFLRPIEGLGIWELGIEWSAGTEIGSSAFG